MTIVNTRRHAVEVYRALKAALPPDEQTDVWHLSSAMCPAHRLEVLGKVRQALKDGHPCRLIATQLIEAGVDVDFSAVFRALAPLDALIQSAGRCNREGKLPPAPDGGPGGRFVMFRPADGSGNRPYSDVAISQTKTTLCQIQGEPARLATDPGLYTSYFDRLMRGTSDSQRGRKVIQDERLKFNFKTVAAEARYIEDAGTAVVVPHGEGVNRIKEFRQKTRPTRDDFRSLQRYLVNLRDSDIKALKSSVQLLNPNQEDGPLELRSDAYDSKTGVMIGERPSEEFVLD